MAVGEGGEGSGTVVRVWGTCVAFLGFETLKVRGRKKYKLTHSGRGQGKK